MLRPLHAAFDWRVIPFVIGETIIVLAAMWIGLMLRGIV